MQRTYRKGGIGGLGARGEYVRGKLLSTKHVGVGPPVVLSFNVMLRKKDGGVTMRVETMFKSLEGQSCTSKGVFEEWLFIETRREL